MDTAGAGILIPVIATVVGSHGLLAVVLVGIAFRIGRLPTREEFKDLSSAVSDNKEEITDTKVELRQEITDTKAELRQEITDTKAELRQEITDTKAELRQEITDTKAELRQEIADTKAELRQEIADTKAELRQEIADARIYLEGKIDAAKEEVLQEIRRSHRQMMLALVNHTHNANGQAVFTFPPETEPVPAPADD